MKRTLRWVAEAADGQLVAPETVDLDAFEVDLALVETDSRECVVGSTYVARVGENSDGHDYAPQAEQNGAVLLVVEKPVSAAHVPQLLVRDATASLGALAKAHLADLRASGAIKVVGITGSVGKTTTKDLLAALLSAFGPTVAPIRSFNNEVGCPLTVLDATLSTRYLVLEMGSSGPTHLTYLTEIAPLDVAVVLTVGRAHLEGFGNVDALAAAKKELVDGLVATGTAVLNFDDPQVKKMRPEEPRKTVGFSSTGQREADVRAEHVTVDDGRHPRFKLVTDQFEVSVRLGLVGAHQVTNALAALAALEALSLDVANGARELPNLGAVSPHRLAIHRVPSERCTDGNEILVVDDAYNANPDSMKAAFEVVRTLASDTGGQPVLVLGEMLELGDLSVEIHEEVATAATLIAPRLILLYGPGAQAYAGGLRDEIVEAADSAALALNILSEKVQCGDVVLLKGSNGSKVWHLADAIVQDGWPEVTADFGEGGRL